MNMHYVKNSDIYYLKDDDIILQSSNEISIAFSHNGEFVTLLKHGKSDMVQKWFFDTREKYLKIENGSTLINELSIITSSEWNIDDLNKIINNTGYLSYFLKSIKTNDDNY